jgi:NDP-hexose 2,3-dehydratase.
MIPSLLQIDNPSSSILELKEWLVRRNREVLVSVEQIPFGAMDGWYVATDGSLHHNSGRFFSIEGVRVQTDYPHPMEWTQPIINQPEIGYLGILTKEIDGMLYLLMQAKIEPGNVNHVQISPTLQATKSNYTQVHGGRKAAYLEYFQNAKPHQIILDQLQSEQGARFLRKRNRNIIIKVDGEVPVLEDFCWLTLGQIKALIQEDNLVNMDTRTVISGIDFAEYARREEDLQGMSVFGRDMIASARLRNGRNSMHEVLSWFTSLKAGYDLTVRETPLNKITDWECKADEIVRKDKKYFRVIGTRVNISNREVTSWCQPLVQPMQQGLCAFVVKKINGVCHFLVQAKMECGNRDVFELAPTVQCLTGNIYAGIPRPPFTDYVLNARKEQIVFDTMQSEEGGRFYHEQNRNMLVVADEDFDLNVPPTYCWMTLGQINNFLLYNNYINIQARSLIAAIPYV